MMIEKLWGINGPLAKPLTEYGRDGARPSKLWMIERFKHWMDDLRVVRRGLQGSNSTLSEKVLFG